jgi:hypothetical protein
MKMTEVLLKDSNRIVLDKLKAKLIGDIQEGYLSLAINERSLDMKQSIFLLLDQIVQNYEFSPLGENWLELQRQEALDVIEFALSHHPHMPYLKVRTSEVAQSMAETFLSAYTTNARYFSNARVTKGSTTNNGDWEKVLPIEYTKISQGNFDVGVIVLDDNQDGVLWMEDFV